MRATHAGFVGLAAGFGTAAHAVDVAGFAVAQIVLARQGAAQLTALLVLAVIPTVHAPALTLAAFAPPRLFAGAYQPPALGAFYHFAAMLHVTAAAAVCYEYVAARLAPTDYRFGTAVAVQRLKRAGYHQLAVDRR